MSVLAIALTADVTALDSAAERVLFDRDPQRDADVARRTAEIVDHVRRNGDVALHTLATELDGSSLDSLEVSRDLCRLALTRTSASLRRALERAAENIHQVHAAFRPIAQEFRTADGVTIARRPDPLARVGVYAPGGRAAYPSSVLMGAIPARVAGVSEVILCSPPVRGTSAPSDLILAAAAIAQIDRIFAVGGAGAIAAMAFGTATIPRVDRIVGPGNAYVAAAKLQVVGPVTIDAPAGPSELLILADRTASPIVLAHELVAQAEHDPLASVVLVSTDPALLVAVEHALGVLVETAARADVIRASFAARGALLSAPTLDAALTFAARWAPEHLLLVVDPRSNSYALESLRNCGTIFVGETASVAFGDYLSGANHVLPTGGLARSWSGLSTSDFVRWTTWQRIDRDAARAMSNDVALLAEAEGLPAHAAAARQWEGM